MDDEWFYAILPVSNGETREYLSVFKQYGYNSKYEREIIEKQFSLDLKTMIYKTQPIISKFS